MMIAAHRTPSHSAMSLALWGASLCLIGCYASSPPAECRARETYRYDPGAIKIVERDQVIVRTIRCEGAYGDMSTCSDDAPASLKFTVTTKQGLSPCSNRKLASICWWGNGLGSSHGDAPGSVDMSGIFTLSSVIGGSTQIIAHIGVKSDMATVRVRLFLAENPGHVESEVVERLRSAAHPHGQISIKAPLDGIVWTAHPEDGKTAPIPILELGTPVTAAWLHIENDSRSIVYDGIYAGSPIALSRASWEAIYRSTEQHEALKVRLSAIADGAIVQASEQRWRIDHGRFYHSPESLAQEAEENARKRAEREKFEQAWMESHVYIPRAEAVERAIQYIRDQGFTDAPPAGPVHYDIVDFGSDSEVLAGRRGSLHPEPVGTLKKAGWWWIAFRSVRGDACRARVVAISFDGARKRMLHQDLSLGQFDDW